LVASVKLDRQLFITPLNLFVHCEYWSMTGRNKQIRKGLWLIWHATIWEYEKSWNNVIFIEILSWR